MVSQKCAKLMLIVLRKLNSSCMHVQECMNVQIEDEEYTCMELTVSFGVSMLEVLDVSLSSCFLNLAIFMKYFCACVRTCVAFLVPTMFAMALTSLCPTLSNIKRNTVPNILVAPLIRLSQYHHSQIKVIVLSSLVAACFRMHWGQTILCFIHQNSYFLQNNTDSGLVPKNHVSGMNAFDLGIQLSEHIMHCP
jgi:hypothetical protein